MTEEKNSVNCINSKRKIFLWYGALALLLCLQLLVLFCFGNRKAGFHEDEYYSYYSTNRTAGLFEPDREWVDRDTFRNEFVVLPGEGFRYGLVALVQSWDVHPPFFYFLLHTVSSLFPGVFSKWLGIAVNMVAFCISFVLLTWLCHMVTGGNKGLTFLIDCVYGFNGVIISGVMFIRMYEWLTVFILLCACLHVRAVKRDDMSFKGFLLPLMVTTYLGFLTQYYYIIFLFFMAAGFCLWRLILDKKLWNCLKYGICCGLSLMLAVLSYPACLSHIFRGYRGTGAAAEFINTENTVQRLGFFGKLMNEYLFDGYLWLWLLILAVIGTTVMVIDLKKKKERTETEEGEARKRAAYLLLLLGALGYFLTVSKTALLLYETSNRYQLPVYGIILLLVISAVYYGGRKIAESLLPRGSRQYGLVKKGGILLLALLFMAGDIHGLVSGNVIFLYEEDAAGVAYAKENQEVPTVIFYNAATPYHVWWCSQELMQYERVYFASEGNREEITDRDICNSRKLVVYAADDENREESLEMLLKSNPYLTGYRMVSRKGLWSVYEFE